MADALVFRFIRKEKTSGCLLRWGRENPQMLMGERLGSPLG